MDNQESQRLQLSWQPEIRDFTEAFAARNRARKAWPKIWAIAGAALVTSLLLFAAGNASPLPYVLLLSAPSLPVVSLVIQPVSVWEFWRRNPILRHPLRAQVDPTGITVSGQATTHYPWSMVHGFLETERVFVVQLSLRKLAFFLLAKRGLPPDRTVDELRDVLSLGSAQGDQRAAPGADAAAGRR